MKTAVFLYILINFELGRYNVNGVEKCESTIETRAVLISCPEKDIGCEDDDPLTKATLADEYRLLQIKPSQMKKVKAEIEKGFPNRVTQCKRKLVITMKLRNKGKIECDDGFIVIDHVYDPITRGKARLLSPVIIKLRQEQMVRLYPLEFQKVVNSNPSENVFSSDGCENYKGCSVESDSPTCGITTYDGMPIPFSEGFCCSSDPYVNAMREILPDKHENTHLYKDPSLFGFQKNRVSRSKQKSSVIINPNLLNMKASNRHVVRQISQHDEDADPNLAENEQAPPNFFFDRDRKIVCSPSSMLKELCNIEKKEDDEDNYENSSEDSQYTNLPAKNNSDSQSTNDKNYECILISRNKNQDQENCPENQNEHNDNSQNQEQDKCQNSNQNNNSNSSPTEKQKDSLESDKKDVAIQCLDDGGQYQFTGNNYMGKVLQKDQAQMKTIESHHGKRELVHSATRHRKKRLTRDNEEYNFSFPNPNIRRKKRLLAATYRKTSNARISKKAISEEDGQTDEDCTSTNCTLPVFFFCHDQNLVCPANELNNSTASESDSYDYESDVNDSENEQEQQQQENLDVQAGSDAEEEALPLPQDSKMAGLHKKKIGMWDVNANVKNGNFFTLDLVKKGDSGGDKPADSFQKMSYEERHFLPNFMDKAESEKLLKTFQEMPEADTNWYRNGYNGNAAVYRQKANQPQVFTGDEYSNKKSEYGMDSNEYQSNEEEALKHPNINKNMGMRQKDSSVRQGINSDSNSDENFGGFRERLMKRKKTNGNIGFYDRDQSWRKLYNFPPSWADPRFFQKEQTDNREKMSNQMKNYQRSDESNNKYLLNSQNVFFADNKPLVRLKDNRLYGENMEDGKEAESRSEKEEQAIAESGFYEPHFSDWKAGEYFRSVARDWDNEDSQRNRRRAGFHDRQSYQKFRNGQMTRHRGKRSLNGTPVQEQRVKISKWEHRKPPGPEYQFDISTLTKPKTYVHSSGAGDKQSLSDIQKNFANVKPRFGPQGTEWEEAGREIKLKVDQKRLMQSYLKSPRKNKRDVHGDPKGKRHVKGVRRQERGGQICEEPKEGQTTKTAEKTESSTVAESESSRESSHCMQLSDLWYSVYRIRKPELAQLVGVQIYDKQTKCDGTTEWRDVTKGYMVRLGMFLQRAEDDVPTISMTFTPTGPNVGTDDQKLDTENYRLLVPSHLTNEKKASLYPEFYGGPSEFMLVRKEEISDTGAECNKIGTSFEAFARQPERCSKPPGSCLKRQPVDLWREDMEARIRGKRGKYFIENFGNVSNTSIKSFTNLTGDFLAMDYYGEYESTLEIEMRADGNAIVRQGENAQIPLVYIDTTTPRKTKIVLSVVNMGLTAALFRPRLGECPKNLDPSWCPLEGSFVLIPPQQRHDFKLELSGVLPTRKVYCAVEVMNRYNKKIANRRIIMRKSDRCFCAFYCKCICISASKHSTCQQLTMEEYNAAGYFDSIPQRSVPPVSGFEAFLENLKTVLISMANALFVLGLIKAILGLFWRRLGIAGVPVIVGPRMLCQYYEYEIASYQVIYDEYGFPIHPQTCKSVQIIPKGLEMFINIFFFYLYLLRVIWLLFVSLPYCKPASDNEGCYKMDASSNEEGSHRGYPSSTNYFTYNVMAFTNKKVKPEETALCSPYKADEDPLEEDDTEFVLEEIKRYKNKNGDKCSPI